MKALSVAKKVLRAIDPNDDPSSEPLSPLALLAVLAATSVSMYLFLRWKIQPMQDVGLHVALTSVVADYGKSGSIYPAIYKPLDWLNTNSLLYTVAGVLGKAIGPPLAFRLTLSTYLLGVPLANLYALRVFGRSAWGAVMAVPFTYNISYVFGFANFLFAAPLAILALPVFYRMLVRPTRGRIAASTVIMTLLFLAHLHMFLWTGVLLAIMTLVAFAVTLKRSVFGLPSTKLWTILLTATISVVPALLLLARWAYRSTQPVPADELALTTVGASGFEAFRSGILPAWESLKLVQHMSQTTKQPSEGWLPIAYFIVGAICLSISRLHRWKRPPVMELACVITLASYFLLPESYAGQQVIASRQLGVGLWFAAAFFSPVPGHVARVGRLFAIVAVSWCAVAQLSMWRDLLVRFQKEEAYGLEAVLAAAPPRKRLHYVNIDPESKYFTTRSFWHAENWYMAERLGQCNENPAWGAMQAVRYRKSYPFHRIENHSPHWPSMMEIWQNYDLILIRSWHPTAQDLELARKNGELVAERGGWQLWRSKLVK